MSQIIVDGYAHLLTKDDVVKLFQTLIDYYGNRNEAAKICGLERKTTYNWTRTYGMELETKKKILNAFMEIFNEDAYELVADKSVENSTSIVYLLLSSIFGQVSTDNISHEEVFLLLSKFDEIKTKYEDIIHRYLKEEVSDMETSLLINKPDEIKFNLTPPKSIRISDLSELLPSLIKEVYLRSIYTSHKQIALDWQISEKFINAISNGLNIIENEDKRSQMYPRARDLTKYRINAVPQMLAAGTVYPYSPEDLNKEYGFQLNETVGF